MIIKSRVLMPGPIRNALRNSLTYQAVAEVALKGPDSTPHAR